MKKKLVSTSSLRAAVEIRLSLNSTKSREAACGIEAATGALDELDEPTDDENKASPYPLLKRSKPCQSQITGTGPADSYSACLGVCGAPSGRGGPLNT